MSTWNTDFQEFGILNIIWREHESEAKHARDAKIQDGGPTRWRHVRAQPRFRVRAK